MDWTFPHNTCEAVRPNTYSIPNQTYSADWTDDDLVFISILTSDHVFVVSSMLIV